MEELAHGLQTRGLHGITAGNAQQLCIQQPGAGAAAMVEIGGEVQALHGARL